MIDLAEALRDGGLSLHYRPIREAASGRPIVPAADANAADGRHRSRATAGRFGVK
jgi:hypothetical protein